MKQFTKRILAIALVACLLLCLGVPAALAAEEKEASITAEYAFEPGKSGLTNQQVMNTVADYSDVNGGLWKFNSASSSGGKINANKYLYINFTSKATGWAAFTIKIPAAGTYTLQLDYEKSTNGANIGVYVLNDANSTAETEIGKDTSSAYYVGSFDEKTGTTGRNTAADFKSITFSAAGEYVIAFDQQGKEDNTRYSHIYGFTLTAELDSVATAAAAASNKFHTVKLLDDVQTETALTFAAGVTLDLNGKTLTGAISTTGTVTDSVGGGMICCDVKDSVIQVDDGEMALYDTNNSAYRIYDYTLTVYEDVTVTEGEKKAVSFWFDVTFDEDSDAYGVISQQGDCGFGVGATFTWNDGAAKQATFADSTAKQWATAMAEKPQYSFYVRIEGFEGLGETGTLAVTPSVTGMAGSKTGSTVTYNVA